MVYRLHNQRFTNEKYLVVCIIQVVEGSVHGKLLVKYEPSLQHA